jgi:riboflavin kinase / FMN adenylyltransferase
MPHLRSLDKIDLDKCWVTVGSFDGVHLGHLALLRSMAEEAHLQQIPVVAVTFYPHPAFVLRKIQGPYYLTSVEEKADLILQTGVDWVITLPFTEDLATKSASEFIQDLQPRLNLQQLWIGYDFALGKNRQGNYQHLKELGVRDGFSVKLIPPLILDGEIVSSSKIRQLIQNGKIASAARLLGRWYSLSQVVTRGDGRGRGLGIPTANLEFQPEMLLPASGVYATLVHLGTDVFHSVTNVGYRPTFNNTPANPLVEVHLMAFSQDLYGHQLKLEFIQHLRNEVRFNSVELLVLQMKQDVLDASEVLSNVKSPANLPTQSS